MVHNGRMLLGLRGPLIDSVAVVVSLKINDDFAIEHGALNFLDLEGLGIRDLTRYEEEMLVLAGLVGDASGPFRIYRWQPITTDRVQNPGAIFAWPESEEKPEGLCVLDRDGRSGLIALYDSPDRAKRIHGAQYRADWLALE